MYLYEVTLNYRLNMFKLPIFMTSIERLLPFENSNEHNFKFTSTSFSNVTKCATIYHIMWKLVRVDIENFKSIKKAIVPISDGFTVITGPK